MSYVTHTLLIISERSYGIENPSYLNRSVSLRSESYYYTGSRKHFAPLEQDYHNSKCIVMRKYCLKFKTKIIFLPMHLKLKIDILINILYIMTSFNIVKPKK